MKKFEEELIVKTGKMMKKKKMKLRKESERAEKAQQTEKEKKTKNIEEKETKRKKDEAEAQRVADEKAVKERQRKSFEVKRARTVRLKKLGDMQTAIASHSSSVEVVQRKLKGLKKKLRDVLELEVIYLTLIVYNVILCYEMFFFNVHL